MPLVNNLGAEVAKPDRRWMGDAWRTPGAFVSADSTGKLSKHNPELLEFCEDGYLINRGVTNSLFCGPAETWIIDRYTKDAAFCKALEISDEQAERIRRRNRDDLRDVPIPFTLKSRLAEEAMIAVEKQRWPEKAHLVSTLTAKQAEKLPAIFLQLEGLIALRRIEFRKLIGLTLDKQQQIVALHDACNEEFALQYHRGIFTLRNDNGYLAPSIALQLRMISVALDHEILDTLSAEHQRRLSPIIAEARTFRFVARGPGAY
jgi:hypothetical protein